MQNDDTKNQRDSNEDKNEYQNHLDRKNTEYQNYFDVLDENQEHNESNEEGIEDEYFQNLPISHVKQEAELGNHEAQEFLTRKYTKENDTENIYKYFSMLIRTGNCSFPLEYTIDIYNRKYFKQAFAYFTLIAKANHLIAQFFVGMMKFEGQGFKEDKEDAYTILKHLSDNGIDEATEFLEDKFLWNMCYTKNWEKWTFSIYC